mmetsp:Transcript_38712/g.63706  ORF Transcript_38712/g.63706 Transcript_38712/m.63706 type:complete len:90 (+) Transcript_38712:2-271(+)
MLFNKIMGRELTAPVIHKEEVFAEQEDEDEEEEDSQLTDLSVDDQILSSPSGKFEYHVPRSSQRLSKGSAGGTPRCCPCFTAFAKGRTK